MWCSESPTFDSFIVAFTACEAISHVRRINLTSAADLMTRCSCRNSVGDSNRLESDPRPRTISLNTSDRSVALSSYQHVLEPLLLDASSMNFWNEDSGCASSTPKKSIECSTPVRAPSHSSSCWFFGRMNSIDLNDFKSSSCIKTRMLSGSRQPVK